ncbi:hypothetical protein [Spirosoma pollinicola]|uniref:T9SS C-terminal target domain-containing protein n=1 Tax=Spirosoma pollinicola TaxID=2057025 RepID=A0A2K8Z6T8_9BACT|nr:hypothetical protein [Spirosoma pollinicola]AUD05554.1 hypothetical protein CWM47_29150 [Spirosoma pollinicola]
MITSSILQSKGLWVIYYRILWLILVVSVHIEAQPVRQWDKTFGRSQNDFLSVTLPTADGGYLLGGVSFETPYFDDHESGNFWLVKVGKDGNKQWDKLLNTQGQKNLKTLLATTDGGYLVGGDALPFINGDKNAFGAMWLIKIDASGNKLWDKAYEGIKLPPGPFGYMYGTYSIYGSMIATADGGYLLGGSCASGVGGDKTQPSKGSYDYWILKLDANGNKQWDKVFGGNKDDLLVSVLASADGGYVLGGNSNSDAVGDKTDPSRDGSSYFDYWVIKIDVNGIKQWDKTYGGKSYENLLAFITTPDGGYLLGGDSTSGVSGDKTQSNRGGFDYWVVKLDANGIKQWDKTLGGNYYDTFGGFTPTPDGGYLIGGSSVSDISGDVTAPRITYADSFDYWIVKLSSTGTKLWDKKYGGATYNHLATLMTTSDGGYLVGGTSSSGVYGDKSQPSQGGTDYWLLKLKDCQLPTNCIIITIKKIKTAR